MRQYSHTGRLLRIYNGIDPGRFHPAEGRLNPHTQSLVVGFAGRLVPGKGADHLIRAFAQASEEVSVELLIAGDGPDRSALEVLAKTLRGASRVRFLGVVDDTPAFWRSCDVAAVASDEFVESFSMTTLEAMASGKAIVATRNGAIPELVVDGVTGTLVPPGNVDALARAIVVYAQRPGLRRAHGEAARSRAIDRFHIEDCARAYLDLFRDLRAGPTSKSADSSMP
jgi:glycosyltransferase involved in cell wall biosynthesis